jgi:hypothetical protein
MYNMGILLFIWEINHVIRYKDSFDRENTVDDQWTQV